MRRKHREIIVLLGKPGSGKGTQAEPLSRALGIPAVSVGKLWRSEIARKTAIGRKGAHFIAAGRLAPNDLTAQIIRKRLAKPDVAKGLILDGYPRDLVQAIILEEITHVTHAFLISIDDRVVIRRLSGRRICLKCGHNYHVESMKPKKPGRCDLDGGRLVRREDDRPAVIRERIKSYRDETIPVLQFYRGHRVLRRVDGIGTIPQVQKRMIAAIHRDDKRHGI
jgi:adenylate kinase